MEDILTAGMSSTMRKSMPDYRLISIVLNAIMLTPFVTTLMEVHRRSEGSAGQNYQN